MWSVGASGGGGGVDQGKDKQGENENLSHGIGLALLSKALGVNKIEDKFQKHMNRLKKTRLMSKFEARHKIQKKIYNRLVNLATDRTQMYLKCIGKVKRMCTVLTMNCIWLSKCRLV